MNPYQWFSNYILIAISYFFTTPDHLRSHKFPDTPIETTINPALQPATKCDCLYSWRLPPKQQSQRQSHNNEQVRAKGSSPSPPPPDRSVMLLGHQAMLLEAKRLVATIFNDAVRCTSMIADMLLPLPLPACHSFCILASVAASVYNSCTSFSFVFLFSVFFFFFFFFPFPFVFFCSGCALGGALLFWEKGGGLRERTVRR